MKNITVSIDDETYLRARIAAAEQATSVSALVSRYLKSLSGTETETERLKREEIALREQIATFSAAPRLARDEIHIRES